MSLTKLKTINIGTCKKDGTINKMFFKNEACFLSME